MLKTSLTTCYIQIKVQILTKKSYMYHMIRLILQYDTIHTLRTLYLTIHEHLRYADMI